MNDETGDAHSPGRAVIALGGNALLRADETGDFAAQLSVIRRTAGDVAEAIRAGHEVVLTHGNGPQVGNRLVEQAAETGVPHLPLDVLVAETQAQLGYLLQQALDNALGGGTDFITIVTQTVVDPEDSAFSEPTKPVGPWYTDAEASSLPFETRAVGSGERPHRRVVPSPAPKDIVEADEIARLVEAGNLVICGGGGGVPVVEDSGYRGVEAVVDKDRTAVLLARAVDADWLLLLTDVPNAFVDYGGPTQRPLTDVDPATLTAHLDAGEFPPGSMRPKVEACLDFVRGGGDRAVIAEPAALMAALEGTSGTQVHTD